MAIIGSHGEVRSIFSAAADADHARFGGIVPEIASRNHTFLLLPLIEKAFALAGFSFENIDGLAVTSRPGLIGSLLTGLVTAQTLAIANRKPFIGVNHLEGHLWAPFLRDENYQPPVDFEFPALALAVSGGHSTLYRVNEFGDYKIIGRTRDDAAGEAFDKFAKTVGLGFPGGAKVDQLSRIGDATRFEFPRALLKDPSDDFSFSGLKSAAARELAAFLPDDRQAISAAAEEFLKTNVPKPGLLADLCASFQAAIVDVLVGKTIRVLEREGLDSVILTGGVAANSSLGEKLKKTTVAMGATLISPPLRYCTDNAAMIGYVGIQRLNRGEQSAFGLRPEPRAPLDQEGIGK